MGITGTTVKTIIDEFPDIFSGVDLEKLKRRVSDRCYKKLIILLDYIKQLAEIPPKVIEENDNI